MTRLMEAWSAMRGSGAGANRHLYNTGTYTFVTLDELTAMVDGGKSFLVYDAKTGGADITRSVLAQIAFEQENLHGAR